ncbi:MAG: putative Co/Zn/Cd efflux system rane fusion protein [Myxococcaceae bacterium]|nr:putative Co/Zn/Cd efflux system rane fusion protein [Myxococcaceae bacterium]
MTEPEQREGLQASEQTPQPVLHGRFEEGEEAAPPGVFAMAIVRWCIVLAMAVAAGASLLYALPDRAGTRAGAHDQQYFCPMHPSVVQDHPGDCPICNMTLVKRATGEADHAPAATMSAKESVDHAGHEHASADAYYCPMHPEKTGTSAKDRCPICGMNLVPKPRAVAGKVQPPPGLLPLELPPERVQLIGMRTAQVRRAALPSSLRVVGVIAPTENAVSSVQTRFSGWVQELHVAQTGEAVKQGQLLARIYSPELLSGQQELLNARSWQASGTHSTGGPGDHKTLLENARNRLLSMGMDPVELAEVERTGRPHRLIEVRSPARGYVADKTALLGLFIQPGAELFRIADLSRVWALIEVFERDAGRLRVGQDATVSLPAYPGETFRGKVSFVYPILSAETRTLRARVELKNPQLKLKPGMFGNVALDTVDGAREQALLIPREALVDMGEHQYVFVAHEAGHYEPRSVEVGSRVSDDVQIVAGLTEGETVVTSGNFLLDSESRLRSAIAGH